MLRPKISVIQTVGVCEYGLAADALLESCSLFVSQDCAANQQDIFGKEGDLQLKYYPELLW